MGQMLLVPKPLFLLNANTLCNVFAAVQLRDKSSAVISAVLLKNPQKSLCAFHVKLLQGHEQSWDQMSLIWSCISDVWQPDNETHNVMISKTLRPDCAVNFEAPLFFASVSCCMKGGVDFILKISDNMRDKVNSFQIWNTAICLHFFLYQIIQFLQPCWVKKYSTLQRLKKTRNSFDLMCLCSQSLETAK